MMQPYHLQRSRVAKGLSKLTSYPVLGREIHLLEQLWRDGQAPSRSDPAQCMLVVRGIVEVVACVRIERLCAIEAVRGSKLTRVPVLLHGTVGWRASSPGREIFIVLRCAVCVYVGGHLDGKKKWESCGGWGNRRSRAHHSKRRRRKPHDQDVKAEELEGVACRTSSYYDCHS